MAFQEDLNDAMTVPDRFSGVARLYGRTALERFLTSHVMVVGIGGVGSWAAESLARAGIGKLTLVDPDDLCLTNTNRQIHALDGTYGQPKARVLAERLRTIHPEIEVVTEEAFFSAKNADDLLNRPTDAVIDAIDSLRAKCALLAGCRQRGLPCVSSGAAGGRRDPTRIRCADLAHSAKDELLAAVRRHLRREYGFPAAPERGLVPAFGIEAVFSDEPPIYPTCDGGVSDNRPDDAAGGLRCDAGYGSITHVTATFGLIAAGRVLEALAENPGNASDG